MKLNATIFKIKICELRNTFNLNVFKLSTIEISIYVPISIITAFA